MKRTEWMSELERNLYVLGRDEREKALSYYAELINDKMERGMRESEIIASFGDPRAVALDIIANSENAEVREGGSPERRDVIRDSVFDDDCFASESRDAVKSPAAEAAAPPLKKQKNNVFVRIILPILGALIGAYLLFSVVVTIIDVSTKKEQSYESDAAFVSLVLDVGSSDVEVKIGNKYSVTYTTSAIRRIDIKEEDDKLAIVERFNGWMSWAQSANKMTVTVPESCEELNLSLSAGSLRTTDITCARAEIDVSAGDMTIENCNFGRSNVKCSAGDIVFADCDLGVTTVKMSAGSVELENVAVTSACATVSAGSLCFDRLDVRTELSVSVSAGDVEGRLVGKEEDFSVLIKVSAGSCNLTSAEREVDKRISVDVSAGSINLEFSA